MIRSETLFNGCRDYLFANLWPKAQELQTIIGDGVVLADFAEKSAHGLVMFNRDSYPVLVVEPSGFQVSGPGSPSTIEQESDVLIQVHGGAEEGDLTTTKIQRYADALVNLIEDDMTFGGAATLVSINGKIKIGLGREGEREFALMLASLTFRK